MKKKILITVIALTAVNLGFAATGKGYRVLSEEMHSAPGFNFHVEEVQPGAAAAQKKSFSSSRVKTSVPSRSGRINQSITVDGYHDFTISNNTKQRQTYEMYVSLDCENLHSYYRRYVEINSGGYYTNSDHSSGTVQEAYTGSYRIEAKTELSGESSDSSRDSNTLYINR